jgi:hypothetical protein
LVVGLTPFQKRVSQWNLDDYDHGVRDQGKATLLAAVVVVVAAAAAVQTPLSRLRVYRGKAGSEGERKTPPYRAKSVAVGRDAGKKSPVGEGKPCPD